ncbi:unnamed protein product [Adineta ricciae]|uniref:Uncharacterized protein n=1 Tax=Adineta ricciae TaxID=249248 RepID=A0A814UKP4_ADIRI|nr:unnamed protein product [Adineta ricciae]
MALEVHQQEQIQVSTIGDTGVVAVAQRSTIEMGMPRNTSKLAFIRNTYPAHYNHVVRNMNSINYQTNTKAKHSMRGGHFLLYRYIISLAIILCLVFGVISIYVKGCASVPFILTVVYIAISIYNIVIYIKNRPLLNPLLAIQVPRDILPEFMNEFYTVPINATVLTGAIAAFVNPAVIAAAVRKDNVQLCEIQIMLYDDLYLRHCRFPWEITVHLLIFIVLFFLAIGFVSAKASS